MMQAQHTPGGTTVSKGSSRAIRLGDLSSLRVGEPAQGYDYGGGDDEPELPTRNPDDDYADYEQEQDGGAPLSDRYSELSSSTGSDEDDAAFDLPTQAHGGWDEDSWEQQLDEQHYQRQQQQWQRQLEQPHAQQTHWQQQKEQFEGHHRQHVVRRPSPSLAQPQPLQASPERSFTVSKEGAFSVFTPTNGFFALGSAAQAPPPADFFARVEAARPSPQPQYEYEQPQPQRMQRHGGDAVSEVATSAGPPQFHQMQPIAQRPQPRASRPSLQSPLDRMDTAISQFQSDFVRPETAPPKATMIGKAEVWTAEAEADSEE